MTVMVKTRMDPGCVRHPGFQAPPWDLIPESAAAPQTLGAAYRRNLAVGA
eukprot:COSAG02_NODE_2194_length_9554_cov_12.883659_9_plen_50_part_00